MSEFGGLRKHEKTQYALKNTVEAGYIKVGGGKNQFDITGF